MKRVKSICEQCNKHNPDIKARCSLFPYEVDLDQNIDGLPLFVWMRSGKIYDEIPDNCHMKLEYLIYYEQSMVVKSKRKIQL